MDERQLRRHKRQEESDGEIVDDEMEALVGEAETGWKSKGDILIPNVTLDDAPIKELVVKAHRIFAGESFENLDKLACRIADACPNGVTADNFAAAKPVAGACKKFFSNVEKLRKGLKRPALDWGEAVDTAAKEMVAQAEPTLRPIINQVKAIEDRKKREKEEREAAEAKRIADEAMATLKAEQDAERKRIADERESNRLEAEKLAAERKRINDQAEAQRKAADELAAKNKAVNDELAELKRQMKEDEERRKAKDTQFEKASIAVADLEAAQVLAESVKNWPPTLRPDFDDDAPPVNFPVVGPMDSHGYPIEQPKELPVDRFTPPCPPVSELDRVMLDAENSAEISKAGIETSASSDQQKVREFGISVASMLTGLKRPLLVKQAARQAVELAVFDMVESCKRLQEWGAP